MKRLALGAFAVCLAGFCSSAVHASVMVGDHLRFGNGPGDRGGIFHIDVLTNGPGYDFDTFCVELEENIKFGSNKYAVEAIVRTTNRTGKALQHYTAWLYNGFLDGTLSGFSGGRTDANVLQLAIWLSMGYSQSDIDQRLGSSFYANHITDLNSKNWASEFDADVASGDWQGHGDIYVMNLRKVNNSGQYTGYAQDQLVRVPNLPEPSTFVVWSLLIGLTAVVTTRGKKKRSCGTP